MSQKSTHTLEEHVNNSFENYIKFDINTFKKTAKRLQKELNQNLNIEDKIHAEKVVLFLIQESLAKSFGFRNQDGINKFFNKNKNNIPYYKKINSISFLQEWNKEDILRLFTSLLDSTPQNHRDRAKFLISVVLDLVIHYREEEVILINSDTIRKYLSMKSLMEYALGTKKYEVPFEIIYNLQNYIFTTPGYNKNLGEKEAQNNIFYENHTYAEMQFGLILNTLKSIEDCDPLIISPNWYQTKYTYLSKPIKKLQIDRSSELEAIMNILEELDKMFEEDELEIYENFNDLEVTPQYINYRLNEKTIQDLYNKYKDDEWKKTIEKNIPIIKLDKNKDNKISFYGIELINPIRNSIYLEDSWLEDESFKFILDNLIKNKQLKNFYLSDLLLYSLKIVNKKKRTSYINCIENLLNNNSSIVEYSEILNDLSK